MSNPPGAAAHWPPAGPVPGPAAPSEPPGRMGKPIDGAQPRFFFCPAAHCPDKCSSVFGISCMITSLFYLSVSLNDRTAKNPRYKIFLDICFAPVDNKKRVE